MYDRIVFDFDGTLLDTGRGVLSTLRYVFDAFGLSYPQERMGRFIGPPLFTEMEKVFGLGEEKTKEMVAAYRKRYREAGLYEYERYEGVEQTLRRLKLAGKKLYVATNKPVVYARAILEHAGMAQYFDEIAGAGMSDTSEKKYENICLVLGGNTQGAVMVGDRINDIVAAKRTGVDSIYVGYGYGSRQEADQCQPTLYAQDAKELMRALGVQGLFITFEGMDGAGKTTQKNLLMAYLKQRGLKVVDTFEPGGCAVAQKIRQILLDRENGQMRDVTEALLYAAARAEHVEQVIAPALEEGSVVLCDRYLDSSMAYQGYGRELGKEFIDKINRRAMKGIVPMRTYYLRVDPQAALARKKEEPDRIESQNESFKRRVMQGFDRIQKEEPGRVFLIDATCPIQAIFDIIKKDIDSLLL